MAMININCWPINKVIIKKKLNETETHGNFLKMLLGLPPNPSRMRASTHSGPSYRKWQRFGLSSFILSSLLLSFFGFLLKLQSRNLKRESYYSSHWTRISTENKKTAASQQQQGYCAMLSFSFFCFGFSILVIALLLLLLFSCGQQKFKQIVKVKVHVCKCVCVNVCDFWLFWASSFTFALNFKNVVIVAATTAAIIVILFLLLYRIFVVFISSAVAGLGLLAFSIKLISKIIVGCVL